MGCECCCGKNAWIILVLGLLFLLQDMGVWAFWNINWWTVVFLYFGVMGVWGFSGGTCAPKGKKK